MGRRRRHVEELSPEERMDRIADILADAVLLKLKKDHAEGRQRGSRRSGENLNDKPREDTVRDGGNP